MITNLILDWSGTLVDDFSATLVATNAVFAAHGLGALSADEFRRDFRLPYPDFYEEFLPGKSLEELEVLFKEAFLESESLVIPLAPTRGFLENARAKGIRLFVLSSMNEEALLRQAESFGLRHYFEGIYAGVLDKRETMGAVILKHGLQRDETAYVGDMVHDVDAARSGGVTALALLSGYDPLERLAAAQPDAIFADIGFVCKLLKPVEKSALRPDIQLRKLRVPLHIGVPAAERAIEQEVKVSLSLETLRGVGGLSDDIAETVDYAAVAEGVRGLAAGQERQLIETLAEDIARFVLTEFKVQAVKVEIDKPILTNCEGVVVSFELRK